MNLSDCKVGQKVKYVGRVVEHYTGTKLVYGGKQWQDWYDNATVLEIVEINNSIWCRPYPVVISDQNNRSAVFPCDLEIV